MKLFIGLWLIVSFSSMVLAEQHPAIQKIVDSAEICLPNIYFTKKEINSRKRFYAYYAELPTSNVNRLSETKDLNLIPVNKCVLHGNKNYLNPQNLAWLKELKVSVILNTDYLAHTAVQGKLSFPYVFLPLFASGYQQKTENIQALALALEYLAKAEPTKKVYINCFSGKYQSNLLAALYQFILEYAKKPDITCNHLTNSEDLGFQQMQNLGNQGLFSYNLPAGYQKFYLRFAKAVCKKNSAELLSK